LTKRRGFISEADLVSLLMDKDERGFNLLYDNYSAAIYGVVLKITRDEAVAQDVVQESFIKIWNNVNRYDSQKGSLFTWILNVSRNLAIDKIRSAEYQHARQSESVDNFVGIEMAQFSESLDVENIGLSDLVVKLKPELKQVVETLYYQGYTQSEAAEKLGIPLGTIKTRAKTALLTLKSWLD